MHVLYAYGCGQGIFFCEGRFQGCRMLCVQVHTQSFNSGPASWKRMCNCMRVTINFWAKTVAGSMETSPISCVKEAKWDNFVQNNDNGES